MSQNWYPIGNCLQHKWQVHLWFHHGPFGSFTHTSSISGTISGTTSIHCSCLTSLEVESWPQWLGYCIRGPPKNEIFKKVSGIIHYQIITIPQRSSEAFSFQGWWSNVCIYIILYIHIYNYIYTYYTYIYIYNYIHSIQIVTHVKLIHAEIIPSVWIHRIWGFSPVSTSETPQDRCSVVPPAPVAPWAWGPPRAGSDVNVSLWHPT